MSWLRAADARKKVLLMGNSGAGKTSMRHIIFANYIPKDTFRLGATFDVEQTQVKFMGNLRLHIWDCGGQEAFMDNYLSKEREQIFCNVEILVYVLDVGSLDWERDLFFYKNCIDAVREHSEDARIFCLLHKMDLVPIRKREALLHAKDRELTQLSLPLKIVTMATSIWDASLYLAWSKIVHSMIPNTQQLQRSLAVLAKSCEAIEVCLFEKLTFLVIASATAASSSAPDGSSEPQEHDSATLAGLEKDVKDQAHEASGSANSKLDGTEADGMPQSASPGVAVTQGVSAGTPLLSKKDDMRTVFSTVVETTTASTLPVTTLPADQNRFEKVSNVIKQFKHSCRRMGTSFTSMEIENHLVRAYFSVFTSNTCVCVIMPAHQSDHIGRAGLEINLQAVRAHFDKMGH